MSGRVTLKDIARAAGMSVASVSLVLNDRPCRLSSESKRRIKDIARQMNYSPNEIARSLVTQRSRTFGLIVPNIESRFFSSLAKNLEERCRKDGYALMIANSNDRSEDDSQLLRMLAGRGVDGLFLVVSNEVYENEDLLDAVGEIGIPYVMVDRVFQNLACDKVHFDNELGGYLATEYLIAKDHEKIGCIVNTKTSNSGRARYRGYLKAMAGARYDIRSQYIVESEYRIEAGYAAGTKLCETDVTAIFAGSDSIALGLLKCLHDRRFSVPNDYSVVSYDNSYADCLFDPPLTGIDQNVGELADHAYALMRRRLGNPEAEPKEEVLIPRLVLGDSVRTVAEQNAFRNVRA